MPPENSAERLRETEEAARHLADARAVLAHPCAQPVENLTVQLSAACERLKSAVAGGPLPPEAAASAGRLRRELAAVRTLLTAAAEANLASMQAAGLLSGVYGRDAESVPAPRVARISLRG